LTLHHALQVSDIDAATVQDIKNAKGDVTKIRALSLHSRLQRAGRACAPNGVTPPMPIGISSPANGMNGAPSTVHTVPVFYLVDGLALAVMSVK
jgi:hypothetical protein